MADVSRASDCVFVQALSIEGDAAGLGLADALIASRARDRRVLVDSFTRHIVNDRFVHSPRSLLDRALRREVQATSDMFTGLSAAGIPVSFTNPAGLFFLRFPRRNHKKLAIVDDQVAYIGGINFSDHNFAWRDLMLRIEDRDAVAFLKRDFLATWNGTNHGASERFGPLELHSFDGQTNRSRFQRVQQLIEGARETLYVECAYVTSPFLGWLEAAARRGVAVTLITPEANNWRAVRDRMAWIGTRSEIDVRFYRGRMTHMKALLADEKTLMLGSANLDMWSYHFQQELVGLITDPAVVADFSQRVVPDGLRSSVPCERFHPVRGRFAGPYLRFLEGLSRLVNG